MKKQLTIDVSTLPEEGKIFSGELDGSLFDMPNGDTKAAGPLEYELHAQKFDTDLLIRGSVSVPIQFTCVRTLQKFIQTIQVENFNTCIELTRCEVNLSDSLREEAALAFPDYPRCDNADNPIHCEIDSRYLAVDKPTADDVETHSRDEEPTPWDALDAIQDDSKGSSQ